MQRRSRRARVSRESYVAMWMARLCILTISVIVTIGCDEGRKIDNYRWTSIEVFYCVGDGANGVVKGKTWKTEDEGVLRRIENAYHETDRTVAMVASAMETNCITIRLDNGESWWLYLFHANLASLHRVPDRRLSYDVSLEPVFQVVLAEEIKRATGDTAFFTYPRNVTIERER
jgi:hypothetical protein